MKKRFTWLDLLLVSLAGGAVSLYFILLWMLTLECSCGAM